MCSTKWPAEIFDFSEDLELGNLQGLLFMFVVCHVIIYVQEGSCFDSEILKPLRVLQTTKHALTPLLRSLGNSAFPRISKPSSSSSPSLSSRPTPVTSSKSLRRGSGISNRNSSTACHIGVRFVYGIIPWAVYSCYSVLVDDFSVPAEDSSDTSPCNQSAMSNLSRSNMPVKDASCQGYVRTGFCGILAMHIKVF